MKNLKKLAKKLLKIKNKEVTHSCSNCEKYGSMRCPIFKPKHNGK